MNKDNLFYLCSLLESISRKTGQTKKEIVNKLGYDKLKHIYDYAPVNHCLPLKQVTAEMIENNNLEIKETCNSERKTTVWDMGKIYQRLIIDISDNGDWLDKLIEVYNSWICLYIDNENLPIYWQSRTYIKECYVQHKILD